MDTNHHYKPELICSIPYNRKPVDTSIVQNVDNKESMFNNPNYSQSSKGRRKKQPSPRRSASLNDTNFKGIYFTMETKFINQEPKVVVTSVLRVGLPVKRGPIGLKKTGENLCNKSGRPRRSRSRRQHRTSDSGISIPSDTDEDLNFRKPYCLDNATDKKCISCGTTRTPLWRGNGQGTALCNACGIRYKKYRIRCLECWHVPRRDQSQVHCCSACGAPAAR